MQRQAWLILGVLVAGACGGEEASEPASGAGGASAVAGAAGSAGASAGTTGGSAGVAVAEPPEGACMPGALCEAGVRCSIAGQYTKHDCECGVDGRMSCSDMPKFLCSPGQKSIEVALGCTRECGCGEDNKWVCSYTCGEGHGCSEGVPCGTTGACSVHSGGEVRSCSCDPGQGSPVLRCLSPNTLCKPGAWCSGEHTCSGALDTGCDAECACEGSSYQCSISCPFCPETPISHGEPCGQDAVGKSCPGGCGCSSKQGKAPTWHCCPAEVVLENDPCEGYPEGFSCFRGGEGFCSCLGGVWSKCTF